MRKNTIRITIVAIAIFASFLALGSWKSSSKGSSTPCEESMEQCSKKSGKASDNMVWETLSGQFFTSTGL